MRPEEADLAVAGPNTPDAPPAQARSRRDTARTPAPASRKEFGAALPAVPGHRPDPSARTSRERSSDHV
ncbi:hypothetical protein [Streptomyces sp. NPDC087294]|uniref:hypothetical protein n=1 Tax=Streptomyces sp. NPDC087294 TaxID=3365777 RepID=UPI00382D87E8